MQMQLVNFAIPTTFLTQADRLAKRESRSRSELFREAIRRYLKEQAMREEDFRQIRQAAARINLSENEAMVLVEKIRNELPMNQ